MKPTIMYCPLNDGHVISEIHTFAQQTFEEKVKDFRKKYGIVTLKGTNPFQNLICTLPVIAISPSPILHFDKVVADYENRRRLDIFWEKNQMELDKPSVPKSTDRDIFFAVAALMQLKSFWDSEHEAEKYEYLIDATDSRTGKALNIKGYRLKNVRIDAFENSTMINLGHDVTIQLSDLTAFGAKDLEIRDEKHLYELISGADLQYFYNGTLIAPCIEEKVKVKNHLEGIHWESEDRLYQVEVTSSEALTKLKLSEKGVEARAETVASVHMLLGCSIHDRPKSYRVVITHGLVVDIRYQGQSIFVAYVPQERFIKAGVNFLSILRLGIPAGFFGNF